MVVYVVDRRVLNDEQFPMIPRPRRVEWDERDSIRRIDLTVNGDRTVVGFMFETL